MSTLDSGKNRIAPLGAGVKREQGDPLALARLPQEQRSSAGLYPGAWPQKPKAL